MIRMTHPQHGATHAYGTAEVERHKALGWSVEVPKADQWPADVLDACADAEPVALNVIQPLRQKPGPKPKAK